ncbi:hypothetical protein [Niveispirillum fermenti]|uniref:hypothetical protein n=1 Tax=Niveispirillum fermenti TaxID=1233113 RepID=UPI003A8BA7D6
MPIMDRDTLIELLNRLGDADDQAVLAAARTIHARVSDSGYGWNDLLVGAAPEAAPAPAAPAAAASTASAAPVLPVEGDILTIIDGLLAHPEISTDTRIDLQDMRQEAEAGTLDPGDDSYVRALAARLSADR